MFLHFLAPTSYQKWPMYSNGVLTRKLFIFNILKVKPTVKKMKKRCENFTNCAFATYRTNSADPLIKYK